MRNPGVYCWCQTCFDYQTDVDAGGAVGGAALARQAQVEGIGDIGIVGNWRTRDRVVLARSALVPGEPLTLFGVEDTENALRRTGFFELNGQPRNVQVDDLSAGVIHEALPKAEEGNAAHVAAPMPGMVVKVFHSEGEKVARGDVLFAIEAMKMETAVHAERAGIVQHIVTQAGVTVEAKDLMLEFTDES